MGLRFRKSIKIGPARVNLSKSGIGYSVGAKGFRVTKKAGGGTRTTASIPGTGISYSTSSGSKKSSRKTSTPKATSKPSTVSSASTSAPMKRSWFNAIFMAVFALIAVAVVAFIFSFVGCLIASIFVHGFMKMFLAKVIYLGIPVVLSFLAARGAFIQLRPIAGTEGDLDAIEGPDSTDSF